MENPKVSFIILAYNQERYIKDAIEGALQQEYDNMEIIISDDCSTDDTFKVINETISDYNGNKNVIVNRNEKNMGLVPHVNKLIFELSSGEIVMLAGGDDVSLPLRTQYTVDYLNKDPECQAVAFSCKTIDGDGNPLGEFSTPYDISYSIGSTDYLKSYNVVTPGYGLGFWKKTVGDFGILNPDCQTEDSTLRFRCLLKGVVVYSSKFGLNYRIHGNNITAPNRRYQLRTNQIAKQFMDDLFKVKTLLKEKDYNLLKNKINFYIKFRSLSEEIMNSSHIFQKCYLFVIRGIIRYFYFLRLMVCK
jgi:glycosyltransferase involved in cell wall biosynthesis